MNQVSRSSLEIKFVFENECIMFVWDCDEFHSFREKIQNILISLDL